MNFATPAGAAAEADILVVGRGAIGCAAALGLSHSGLRVALVGPPPVPDTTEWDARIFALSPASRSLLESLRVWSAMDPARIATVYDMRVYPDARADAPELHFGAADARVDHLASIVENRNLMRALEQALAFSAVRRVDQTVVAARTGPDHATLTLADGAEWRARLVVAADGADSPVRGLLGVGARVRDYPQHAVVANFRITRGHRDGAWQWFGAHGVLALLPLPGDACSLVWSAPCPLADSLMALSPSALAERVSQVSMHTLGELTPLGEARRFPLRLVEADRLIDTRLVLLGDAAHVVHPLAGQGMNLGFGDVAELLRVFRSREAFRDPGDRLLLRRFERARREPVWLMKTTTDSLQRLFDPDAEPGLPAFWRPLVGLRELGWRVVANTPGLRERLIRHAVS